MRERERKVDACCNAGDMYLPRSEGSWGYYILYIVTDICNREEYVHDMLKLHKKPYNISIPW
jgi:hypothetical protein